MKVLPGLIKVDNISDQPFKTGSRYDYVFKLYGVELAGQWIADEMTFPTRYVGHSTGEAESWWTQIVVSDGDKSTLSVAIDYNIPKSLMSEIKVMALMAINRRQVEMYLSNIKEVFELV